MTIFNSFLYVYQRVQLSMVDFYGSHRAIGCHFFDHGRWPISRHWLQDSKPCLRLIVLTPSILGGATRDVPATTTRFFRRLLSLPHTDLCWSESIFRYYVYWLHYFAFGSHAVWCKEIQLGLGFSLVPLVSLACPPLPYAPFLFYFFNKRIHVHPDFKSTGFLRCIHTVQWDSRLAICLTLTQFVRWGNMLIILHKCCTSSCKLSKLYCFRLMLLNVVLSLNCWCWFCSSSSSWPFAWH